MDEKLKELIKFIHEQKEKANNQANETALSGDDGSAMFYTGKRSMCIDILVKAESLIFV